MILTKYCVLQALYTIKLWRSKHFYQPAGYLGPLWSTLPSIHEPDVFGDWFGCHVYTGHGRNVRGQCAVYGATDGNRKCKKLALQWRPDERDGVSNHRRPDCLLNCLFRRRSQATSKLCVTGPCEGNPPVTCGFPSQRASNTENVSIWWRHHEIDGKCR